jgi:hypothetical protein
MRDQGLFQKYKVARVDQKPITDGCIVLEWKDPNARKGIAAFSEAVRSDGYFALADGLDQKLATYKDDEKKWTPITETPLYDPEMKKKYECAHCGQSLKDDAPTSSPEEKTK